MAAKAPAPQRQNLTSMADLRMPNEWDDKLMRGLEETLVSRQDRGILRRLCASEDAELVDFSSNDFLSLSKDERLRVEFLESLHNTAGPILGASGSRLLVPAPHHVLLEKRLARMWSTAFSRQADVSALAFATGYAANVAFWSSVPQEGDVIFFDELIHASVHDGFRLGRAARGSATATKFPHNDLAALRSLLDHDAATQRNKPHTIFVAVESLYSMDGDTAPIADILELLAPYGPRAKLVVDEAHAVGVFNRGLSMPPYVLPEDASRVFARTITFGKALGVAGAALIVPEYVKQFLVNYGRPFVFSTAPAVFNILAVQCALDTLDDGRALVLAQRLQSNIRFLLLQLHQQLADTPTSIIYLPVPAPGPQDDIDSAVELSPIIPLLTPQPHALSAHLRARFGVVARPIAWPTVPKGRERIRVCVTAGHTLDELLQLARGVGDWTRGHADDGRPVGAMAQLRSRL